MTILDRLLGRPAPQTPKLAKAVTSLGPWGNGAISLSYLMQEPQEKAAVLLRAYRVGWFYKAGHKIAGDISGLDWSISDGDMEESESETTLPRPDLRTPFARLSPIDQLQRLLEKPNPAYTGRQLLHKTQVRLDFAGAAAWYLEGATSGLPTAIYGISPARMWPSYDSKGRLIGWVMDKDSPSGGVPFDKREILWFTTGNADNDDIWGTSVVEAVYSQVPLTDLMARHTANVLTTGGRLAGMLWPKDRALSEDEFTDAQRAWRNVSSDPDAGKRLLIFPEPMEYAAGASTPQEIGIPELATLNRDEILTAFPLSPYQLGVPMPGGLNSAETRREDRRDYWEGTIHPRTDLLEEVIQTGLVSIYEEALGQTFDFELEEPNLDDAASLVAKTEAAKSLVAFGFDPKESIKASGLDHIKWLALPPLLDPANQAALAQQAMQAQQDQPQEPPQGPQQGPPKPPQSPPATRSFDVVASAVKARDDVVDHHRSDLAQFLRDQQQRVIEAMRALPASKAHRTVALKSDPTWWDKAKENQLLQQVLFGVYLDATRGSLQVVADSLERIVPSEAVRRIVADLEQYGGERIADINARTLQSLVVELAEGARRGYSISQLIEGVPDELYKGVKGVTLDNGLPVFGDLRAETIARTETALSYNRAALDGYKEFNVTEVLAYDGDGDPECAERNGRTFPIDEALAIDDHPNGTLDWAPVVDKAVHEPGPDHIAAFIDAIKTITERPQPDIHVHTTPPDVEFPAPIVNVEAPDLGPIKTAIDALRDDVKAVKPPVVNVPAPIVNVPAPVVNVKAPSVTDVRVTALPERAHRIVRDKTGKPTGSVETDA